MRVRDEESANDRLSRNTETGKTLYMGTQFGDKYRRWARAYTGMNPPRAWRISARSPEESEGLNGQSSILFTAFGAGRLQAITFPHGDTAFNQDLVCVVDDAVHDCLGNGAAGIGIGINACIPALRLVLGAENHGALAAGLHDFQQ